MEEIKRSSLYCNWPKLLSKVKRYSILVNLRTCLYDIICKIAFNKLSVVFGDNRGYL